MKKFYSFFCITLGFAFSAQEIPYEKIDSISSKISEFQLKSDGLVYNDGKENLEVNFPEKNFQILVSTRQAIKSVSKRSAENEFIYITENIDLSKVDEIYQVQYPGTAGVVRMGFPEGIKTQIYANGEYLKTSREYFLEFFYDRSDDQSLKSLLTLLDQTFVFFNLGKKVSKEQFQLVEKAEAEEKALLAEKTKNSKTLTVDDVIGNYIAAAGGEDKIKVVKTIVAEGVMEMQGINIPVKTWFVSNVGMRMEMEIQGKANISVITDKSAWTLFPVQRQRKPIDADAITLKEGAEELAIEGDLVNYKAKGSTVELLGKENIGNTEVYHIKLVRSSGTVVYLLIDAETFLVTKRIINKTIQGKTVEMIETFSDYKTAPNGFVYPTSFSYMPANTTLKYTSYEINTPINPTVFEKP